RRQNLSSTGWLDDATKQALGMQPATPSAPPPGGLETAPRFVHQPKPEYPVLARQQGLEGTVTLHIELLADGTVGAVDIAESSGHSVLDTAAQNAVQHWTHSPATPQGTPVNRWMRLNVHFALDKEPEAGQETEDRGAQSKDQG
ncbi:MAG: energy transducer TonB, partial [Candidatus Tectomicrobia bacterium]